jgi:hypothetical protein
MTEPEYEPYNLDTDNLYDMTITLGEGKDALSVNGMFVPYPEVEGRRWELATVTFNGQQYQALIIEYGSFLRRCPEQADTLKEG